VQAVLVQSSEKGKSPSVNRQQHKYITQKEKDNAVGITDMSAFLFREIQYY